MKNKKMKRLIDTYEKNLQQYIAGKMPEWQWINFCEDTLEELIKHNRKVLLRLKEGK